MTMLNTSFFQANDYKANTFRVYPLANGKYLFQRETSRLPENTIYTREQLQECLSKILIQQLLSRAAARMK